MGTRLKITIQNGWQNDNLSCRQKEEKALFFCKSGSQTNDPNSETVKISLYMFSSYDLVFVI